MKSPITKRVVLALFLLLVCVLWLIPRKHAKVVQSDAIRPNMLEETQQPKFRRSETLELLSRHPDVITVANSMQASPTAIAERAIKTKMVVEDKNVEINFSGKVVDQNDQPLAGVVVKAETREWHVKNLFEPAGEFARPVTVTGADGQFSFTRLRGDAFGILSLTKDGYVVSTRVKMNYSYGPLPHHFLPNPLAPVIFRMWKTNGAVPLYVVDISKSIPQDGTVLAFDLRQNRQTTQPTDVADIRIRLEQHAPPGQRNVVPHFDWTFALEVVDGGILRTQDEFMYLAPVEGYQPKWSIEHLKDQADWKFMEEADFYLRNRAGEQYGRLKITFKVNAGYPTGHFTVRGYLNPTGRVLEYDGLLKLPPLRGNQPRPQFGSPPSAPVVSLPPANGAVISPPPNSLPPGSPAPPPFGAPNLPQPPPGFQALTNRGKAFPPPVPARPQ